MLVPGPRLVPGWSHCEKKKREKNLTSHSKYNDILDKVYFANALATTEHAETWHNKILAKSEKYDLNLEEMFFETSEVEGSFPSNLDPTIRTELAADQQAIGIPIKCIDLTDVTVDQPGSSQEQIAFAAHVSEGCHNLLYPLHPLRI